MRFIFGLYCLVVSSTLFAVVRTDAASQDCSGSPADIVFLLDASTSVWFDNFDTMKQFVANLTLEFAVASDTVRIGVATFSTSVHNEFDLDTYAGKPQELADATNKIDFMTGGTRTDLALAFARNHSFTPAHGDRPGAPNILIMLTDGKSNKPNLTTIESQDLHDIQVVAIGISKLVDVQELKRVASSDNDVYLASFDTLYTVADRIKESVCRITVATTAPPVAAGTTPSISLTTTKKDMSTTSPILAACYDVPLDVVFLVDSSGSLGVQNFELLREFIIQFASSFDIGPNGTQIGVVTFGTVAEVKFHLNEYHDFEDLKNATEFIDYSGGATFTHEGLKMAREECFTASHGNRSVAPDILILLTDGRSTYVDMTASEAALIHQEKIQLIAIGVGAMRDDAELQKLGSTPQNVFSVDNITELDTLADDLRQTVCGDCRTAPVDVVFLLDSSASMGYPNFKILKQFIVDFANSFDLGPNTTQIGVVSFGNRATTEFDLNAYHDQAMLVRATDNIIYQMGQTYTHEALKTAREHCFQPSHGDRPTAPNIVILLTDGVSSQPAYTKIETAKLKQTNARVIAVGIGNGTDAAELRQLASTPNDVFSVDSFTKLNTFAKRIMQTTCDATLSTTTSTTNPTTPTTTTPMTTTPTTTPTTTKPTTTTQTTTTQTTTTPTTTTPTTTTPMTTTPTTTTWTTTPTTTPTTTTPTTTTPTTTTPTTTPPTTSTTTTIKTTPTTTPTTTSPTTTKTTIPTTTTSTTPTSTTTFIKTTPTTTKPTSTTTKATPLITKTTTTTTTSTALTTPSTTMMVTSTTTTKRPTTKTTQTTKTPPTTAKTTRKTSPPITTKTMPKTSTTPKLTQSTTLATPTSTKTTTPKTSTIIPAFLSISKATNILGDPVKLLSNPNPPTNVVTKIEDSGKTTHVIVCAVIGAILSGLFLASIVIRQCKDEKKPPFSNKLNPLNKPGMTSVETLDF